MTTGKTRRHVESAEDSEAREKLDRALAADAGQPYMHHTFREMNEKELSRRVGIMVDARSQLWGAHSYDYHHRSGKGWPDWVIIGPGGILFRELKGSNGDLSEMQRWVGRKLKHHGNDWAVWNPGHLADGTIERELDALLMASQRQEE
jgi:hypothetical protein